MEWSTDVLSSWLTGQGAGSEPNSAAGNAGAELLIPNITDTRTQLSAMSLPKTVPVGTADAGAFFNNEVLAAVDYGMSNVHPWFANVSIDDAAAWTYEFFQENNVAAAQALSNKPQMFIAETGWPTVSFPPMHASLVIDTSTEIERCWKREQRPLVGVNG